MRVDATETGDAAVFVGRGGGFGVLVVGFEVLEVLVGGGGGGREGFEFGDELRGDGGGFFEGDGDVGGGPGTVRAEEDVWRGLIGAEGRDGEVCETEGAGETVPCASVGVRFGGRGGACGGGTDFLRI